MTVTCVGCGKDLNPHDYGVWTMDEGHLQQWSARGMSSLSPRRKVTLNVGGEVIKQYSCTPCMEKFTGRKLTP